MPVTEAAIATTAKVLAPILVGLYKAAKGPIQEELQNWASANQAKKIAKTLAKIENVKTLWSPDKEVSLHSFYFPSKVITDDAIADEDGDIAHGHRKDVKSLADLPDGNLTIQGIVGQGKSIFLRYLASQLMRSPDITLPIFIELRTLTQKLSLRQAIYRVLESVGVTVSEKTFSYLAGTGRFVLLLDAFDELQEDLVTEVLNELDFLSIKHPELRIIVTSRPGNEIQKVNNFLTVNLGPLLRQDFPTFLQKLHLSAVKRADLLRAIDASPSNISEIVRTPLLLTLVVIVYESEREIPPTLSDFFERLFQVVFTRHDRLKAGFNRKHHSGLSERRLQLLFEAFCFMAMQSGHGRTLTREQFINSFDRAVQHTQGCQCEVEKFRLDITKVACLMLEEGIDLATFLHKSIMEYYASAFIAHSSDDVAELFYSHARNNYKQWESVVTFLRDIDPYRFAKHYTMQDAPPLMAELISLQAERSVPKLLAFIERHQPGIGAAIRKESPKSTRPSPIRAYGPMTRASSIALSGLPDALIRAMDAVLPNSLDASQLKSIVSDGTAGRSLTGLDDEILVTHDVLVRTFGAHEFWSALAVFQDQLNRSVTRATEIIESQERRKLIFQQ